MKKTEFSFGTSIFFKSLFENSRQNAALVMDDEGFIITVNKAFTDFFGYTAQDITGKNARILFRKEDRMKNLPERELQNVKEHGSSEDNNYTVHKDGSWIWVSGESIRVITGQDKMYILKLIQNINEQKRLEIFLQESNDFNENILNQISDFIVVLSKDLRLLKANNAFLNFFGTTMEMAEGQSLNSIFGDAYTVQSQTIIRAVDLANGSTEATELEFNLPDERRIFTLHISRMKNYKHSKDNLLMIFHDITLERIMNEQRDNLIGFVSHELRNPLTSISLGTDLVRQCITRKNSDEALAIVERMQSNLIRVNTIIGDLYEVTKAGSGNLKIDKVEFAFEEMIEEVIATLKGMHPDQKFIRQGEASTRIYGDRWRLSQVLMNYLNNAIKYSPSSAEVWLNVSTQSDAIVVSVTDFGVGISREKIRYVFNKYYREERTNKAEGVGLGLYISKEIVRAHGGKVWVESEVGKGSTFYFSIPMK